MFRRLPEAAGDPIAFTIDGQRAHAFAGDTVAAALLLACLFGFAHSTNPGEAKLGLVMAGSFGLVAAFALYRTGNLWLPIGMHASWDWGETYFYGTPDSGLLARGHFLNSAPHGPAWLSGGSVGPEGSWLVLGVLVLWAIAIHFLFPTKANSAA